MAIIRKKIENLKPGKEYLLTVRAKNPDVNLKSGFSDSIRFVVPQDETIPNSISNLQLKANFEKVMFIFDFSNDKDVAHYQYELYNSNSATPPYLVSSGYNPANVFTISVNNSYMTDSATPTFYDTLISKSYWGRVRTVDTTGNIGPWTSLIQTDQNTPLITEQYINSLTASKITAGTIGAHTITLNGVSSILKSSNYSVGTTGWKISGDGDAEFATAIIRGTIDIGTSPYKFKVLNTGNVEIGNTGGTRLFIGNDGAINIGTALGNGPFRVSSSGQVTIGTSPNLFRVNVDGSVEIGNTGSTRLFINNDGAINIGTSLGSGQFVVQSSGQVDIGGNDSTSFHIDNTGEIWAGANSSSKATAPFRLSNDGSIDIGGNDSTSLHILSNGDTFTGSAKRATAYGSSSISHSSIGSLSGSTITVNTTVAHDYIVNDRITTSLISSTPVNQLNVIDTTVISATSTSYVIANPLYKTITAVTFSTPAVGKVQYQTSEPHRYRIGQLVTISGLAPSGYNGTFVITDLGVDNFNNIVKFSVANSLTSPVTDQDGNSLGLGFSRNITAVSPSTPAVGTVRYTTSVNHQFSVGQSVTISGLAPSGYNGTFTITNIAATNTFDVSNATVAAVTDAIGTAEGSFYVISPGQSRRIPPFNLTASTGAVRASFVVASDKVAGSANHLDISNVLNLTSNVALGNNTLYATSSYSSYDEGFNIRLNAAEGFLGRIDTTDSISIGANAVHGLGYWSNLPVVVENGIYGNEFHRRTSGTQILNTTNAQASWFDATHGGQLGKYSSAQRYKENISIISDEDLNPNKLLQLPVVQFKYRDGALMSNDIRAGKTLPGFIAEEVNDIYPIACDKGIDGAIEGWNANIIIPPMLKLIQDLYKKIEILENRLNSI